MQKAIKKKALNTVTVISVLAVLLLSFQPTAQANTGFTVTPVLPENQHPEYHHSFNLNVYPGQRQEIQVEITNPTDEPILVEVTLISPGTNLNGVIDHTATGKLDETLETPFHEMASLGFTGDLTIPPSTAAIVPILLEIPEEGIDGIRLGAIHVLLQNYDEEVLETAMIRHRFAHAIVVRLWENDTFIPADFLLGDVGVDLVNHRAAMVVNIRNPLPRFTMGAMVETQIYTADGAHIVAHAARNVDFAPNAVFPSVLPDDAGYGINPGDYIARVQIHYSGLTWELEESFTIAAQAAGAVNDAVANQQFHPGTQPAEEMSAFVVVAICLSVALLIFVVVLILRIKWMKQSKSPPKKTQNNQES